MSHRFKLAQWLVRPDLLEIDDGSKVHYLEPEMMAALLCLVRHEGQPVSWATIDKALIDAGFPANGLGPDIMDQLIFIFESPNAQPNSIERLPNLNYRLIAPITAVLTNEPKPQPKWHPDRERSLAKTGYPIWPMALITAAALILGLIWVDGGFKVGELHMATALAQPITSLPGRETDAAISPDGRFLAFSWAPNETHDAHLYLKEFATESVQQLTYFPSIDHSPAWSPDGQRVAFIRETAKNAGLRLLDLKLNQETALHALSTHQSQGLSWSPDGEHLAFSDQPDPEKPSAIMMVNLATTRVHQISQPPTRAYGDFFPRFSPSGEQFAFIRGISEGEGHIYTSDLSGYRPKRVATLQGSLKGVEWLSDRKLLFSSNHQGPSALMWVDIEDKQPSPFLGVNPNASRPALSPDGQYLAYETLHENANILTFSLEDMTWPRKSPLRTAIASSQWDSAPQFSPDGHQIAFSSNRGGHSRIWLSDLQGGNPRPLTPLALGTTRAPRWSPDGKIIAFEARPSGEPKYQIFVVPACGGPIRKVSDGRSNDLLPTWSSCGNYIYFHSNRHQQQRIWRMPVTGGEALAITSQKSMLGFEDAKGEGFYFVNHQDENRIWRHDLLSGEEIAISETAVSQWGNWILADNGIYYLESLPNGRANLQYRSWDSQQPRTLRVLPFVPENLGFAFSAKNQLVAVVQQQPPEGDIMLLPLH